MPIKFEDIFNFKNFFLKNITNNTIFSKMVNSLATSESPGFSYLLLFKEEFYRVIAEGLDPSPTV